MMKALILLPVIFILSTLNVKASDRWEILLNKKVILKGTTDDESQVYHLRSANLKRTDVFTLRYTSENTQSTWNRTFYVTDSEENNLKTVKIDKQSGQVSVKASAVKQVMGKKQTVFIYTTSLPKDPAKAAAIRIRRILLCKVEWN